MRLDGGFATPEILDFLDDADIEYAVGIGANTTLTAHAEACMKAVRARSEASGQSEHDYAEAGYSAARWETVRRVVIKAEVVRLPGRAVRDNPRFVLTNIHRSPRFVYERIYCRRALIENRIKELLHGLSIDRTGCSRFLANQLRGLLGAAAYVLYQEIRLAAADTSLAAAQVTALRERLVKLGAWLTRSSPRIVLHLPASAPWRSDWLHIARVLGAAPAPG